MRLASLVIALFAWHATSAFGATVISTRVDESDSGPPPQWAYSVEFKAAKGESNFVTVHFAGGKALIRDEAAQHLRVRGRFCERLSEKSVRCPADLIYAKLGDGSDELYVTAAPSETDSTGSVEDIEGGTGDDTIVLGYGGIAHGGGGDDLLDADADRSARSAHLDGGTGSDRVTGSFYTDLLTGGRGDDAVRGRRGGDRVNGGSGDDRLYGGAGPDRLNDNDGVAPGRDKLFGGQGRDIVESYRFRRGQRPVFVNLNHSTGGERGEDDSLSGIENVWSGAGDDTLIGSATGNKLVGGEGDDALRGRGGNDTLDAGEQDRVSGGGGDDNVRTSPAAEASVTCGPGTDGITSKARSPESEAAGPLLAADCERIARHARGPFGPRVALALNPFPRTIEENGDMTFTVFEFECCDETLELTRPERPFETLDSAPIDASEITVTAQADALRAQAGTASDQLVWRFCMRGGKNC